MQQLPLAEYFPAEIGIRNITRLKTLGWRELGRNILFRLKTRCRSRQPSQILAGYLFSKKIRWDSGFETEEISQRLIFRPISWITYQGTASEKYAPAVFTKRRRIIDDKLLESHEVHLKRKQLHIKYVQAGSSVTCARARKKVRSITFFLEFSLVTFFVSRQRK
jgi:hypothetical protein